MKSKPLERNGGSASGPPGRWGERPSTACRNSLADTAELSSNLGGPENQPGHPSLPSNWATPAAPVGNEDAHPAPKAEAGCAIELPPLAPPPLAPFGSLSQFEDAQRMATLLARSSIVPENYRGEAHLGDCVIALEIANRIGAPILAVMQNLQHVRGKSGWSSQFLISCVNASKRFSPLRYEMTGTRGTDSWGCIAWAFDRNGERLPSPEVTIKMAKLEGWYYRPGSKWRSLPELMLRYRSATLFTRLYAPELTMGIQTTEEVVELAEGNALATRPSFTTEPAKPEGEPGFKPETSLVFPRDPAAALTAADATTRTELAAAQETFATPPPAAEHPVSTGHYHYLKALRGLIGLSPHSEADVLTYLRQKGRCDSSPVSLAEVAGRHPDVMVWIHDHWNLVDQELTQLGKGRTP